MPNSQVKSLTINGTTYDIVDETSGYITGMTVLSYGNSTYADALAAYQANKTVYCRASSNANPATGNQLRMAFLAYVNDATTPTEFEFQYYRSVSTHSDSQQGDQVFVYKLNSSGTWSVTTREAYTKIIAGTGMSSSYSNGALTLTASSSGGTVTSVGLSNATNGGLTVSGSPITSNGTLTVGHSNVLTSAQTTSGVYPIKIDKNGHITEYGSAVTSMPASDVYSWAKASSKPSYSLSEISNTTNLQVIEGLSGIGGLLRKEDDGVWSLDKSTYLTSSSTLNAAKLSGAIPSAVTATTQSSSDNSTKIATTAYVTTAISNLPEPMLFKGSVGTGGTVTWANLATAAASNEGFTYKVITDHSAETGKPAAKVGDTIISNGSEWIVIPSGDEPSGTVTSVGLSNATNGGLSVSGSPITSSGSITIGHSNVLTSAQTTEAIYPIKIDKNGHISSYGSAVTIPDVSGKIDTAGVGLAKSGTTLKAKLNSETAITDTSKVYNVGVNSSGELCVKVSWSDIQTRTSDSGTARTIYLAGGTTSSDETGGLSKHASISATVSANSATAGTSYLTLGNSTASSTAGGKEGYIRLYGSSTSYTDLKVSASTSAKTITFPDKTGTVALTSDIPSNIFMAEINSATYNEVASAVSAGKWVFAYTTNSYDSYNYYEYAFEGSDGLFFCRMHGKTTSLSYKVWILDDTDTWTLSTHTPTYTPTSNTLSEFDSTAHMNSTDMSSSDISNFIEDINIASISAVDYVIEQGTSGSWSYIKWNSGKCEQWYYGNPGSYTVGTAKGNWYAGGDLSFTYPIPFVGTPVINGSVSLGTSAYVVLFQFNGFSNTACQGRIVAGSSISSNSNYWIFIHAVGKWK